MAKGNQFNFVKPSYKKQLLIDIIKMSLICVKLDLKGPNNKGDKMHGYRTITLLQYKLNVKH